ncbi:MAG: hypothetical protein HY319_24800 [Armatimonadetes bacterium]|nr:hypothetical protein [Armatimonadota bacterium]
MDDPSLEEQLECLRKEIAALRHALADFCAGHEESLQALCEQVSYTRNAVERLERDMVDHLLPRVQPRRGRAMSEEGQRALDRLAAIRRTRAV